MKSEHYYRKRMPDPAQRHAFPKIDFKFQHTGETTALLWKFSVEVLKAEVDLTPSLCFEAVLLQDNSLRIRALNRGWGAAYGCSIQLSASMLDEVFSKEARSCHVDIPGGSHYDLILNKDSINSVAFERLSTNIIDFFAQAINQEITNEEKHFNLRNISIQDRLAWVRKNEIRNAAWNILSLINSSYREQRDLHSQVTEVLNEYLDTGHIKTEIPGISDRRVIPLTNKLHWDITWQCKDNRGEYYEEKETVALFSNHVARIFLTQGGFFVLGGDVYMGATLDSDATYVTIIDPRRSSHERSYSISRQIPPKGVDRFHILVAAPMSCQLLLRFKFYFDRSMLVTSDLFDISIWNPRDSGWQDHYSDGGIFRDGV